MRDTLGSRISPSSAAYFTASIAWLESRGTADFEALLRLATVKRLASLTAARVDVPLLRPMRSA